MDKVNLICRKNTTMMHEFSKRCIFSLKTHFMFKMFFSLIQDFLEENVLKEIEKDELIIKHTAAVFDDGNDVDKVDVDGIFQKTRDIDRNFINKVSLLPLLIDIRYDDIKDIRKKRIKIMSRTVFDLLSHWKDSTPFVNIIRGAYTEEHFKEIITEILRLYSLETKILSKSVKLIPPVNIAKKFFTTTISNTMEEIIEGLAYDFTKKVFRNIGSQCHDAI